MQGGEKHGVGIGQRCQDILSRELAPAGHPVGQAAPGSFRLDPALVRAAANEFQPPIRRRRMA
jgi:hypothetical protein